MNNLQATMRRHLVPILLLLLAGGYLVILGELVLYRHWGGLQSIGFAATAAGLLVVLLGLFARRSLRIALAFLLAAISLSGVVGVYEHFENRAEGDEAVHAPALVQTSDDANFLVAYRGSTGTDRTPAQEDEEGERGEGGERGESGEGGEEVPPPFAPLSLVGLSLMGATILLAKQD